MVGMGKRNWHECERCVGEGWLGGGCVGDGCEERDV